MPEEKQQVSNSPPLFQKVLHFTWQSAPQMTVIAEARAAVERYLKVCAGELPDEDTLVILEEKTIERSWGWVFFYTSRLWHQTGEFRYALAGNAPLIVERHSGRILPTGTASPVEQYIANYERTGKPSA